MPSLNEIIKKVDLVDQGPATLSKAALSLELCNEDTATLVQLGRLREALKHRFYREKRKQISEEQLSAIKAAVDFGCSGGPFTKSFPQLRRSQVCLQLIARILDPGLIKQGNTLLCGPASVAMALVRTKPLTYVECCASLADFGQARVANATIRARMDIRDYAGEEHLPGADWILLASLINEPRAKLKDATGSSAEGIFQWLVDLGYSQVVVMQNYPYETVRCHPQNLLHGSVSASNKATMAKTMCDLSSKGAPIVLLAFGELAKAVEALKKAQAMKLGFLDSIRPRKDQTAEQALQESINDGNVLFSKEQTAQLTLLRAENPWAITLLMKQLTGKLGSHALHATYVSKASLVDGKVFLSCANWGASAKGIELPFDAFANKMVGFVSALP